MPKFRKRPVSIEARQFESRSFDHMQALTEWINIESGEHMAWHNGESIFIKTLEGEMVARVGDWIIQGVAGEFYPCKPGIFEATYEAAE